MFNKNQSGGTLSNVQYEFIYASNLHKQGEADKLVMSEDEYTRAAMCTEEAQRLIGCLDWEAHCHLVRSGFDFFHRKQLSSLCQL